MPSGRHFSIDDMPTRRLYSYPMISDTVIRTVTQSNALRLAKYDWLRAHRGVLRGVAGELGVSASVVSRVFHQRERSARIEARFADLGAPGFMKKDESHVPSQS